MKKLILSFVFLQCVLLLAAQNKQGNWLVGVDFGSTGINFGDSESGTAGSPNTSRSESSGFSFSINPNAGYYLTDRVVVGSSLTLAFGSSKNKNSNSASPGISESKSNYTNIGIGPFGRFYLGNNNSKGMPYAEVGAAINFYPGYKGEFIPSTGTGYTYDYEDYHPWSASVELGYEHFLNSFIGLQYYIAYSYYKYKYNTVYHTPSLPDASYFAQGHTNSITFGVGLKVHLDCARKKK